MVRLGMGERMELSCKFWNFQKMELWKKSTSQVTKCDWNMQPSGFRSRLSLNVRYKREARERQEGAGFLWFCVYPKAFHISRYCSAWNLNDAR